jgi:hypothetical protein
VRPAGRTMVTTFIISSRLTFMDSRVEAKKVGLVCVARHGTRLHINRVE